MALVILPLHLAVVSAIAADEPGQEPQWGDLTGLSLLPGEVKDPVLDEDLTLASDPKPAPSGPDWGGLGRDTAFLVGYQLVVIGVLYALPSSTTHWNKKDSGVDQWWNNVKNPVFDEDSWFVNYIGHSYFGATYYIRARERGFDQFSSFLYSAFASSLYEFGIEAFFEPPSIQDLIVTPIGGSLVGAFLFEPLRNSIKLKPELKWYDHAALVATDPLGSLNSVFERLFGIKSEIRVHLKAPSMTQRSPDRSPRLLDAPSTLRTSGVSFDLTVAW